MFLFHFINIQINLKIHQRQNYPDISNYFNLYSDAYLYFRLILQNHLRIRPFQEELLIYLNCLIFAIYLETMTYSPIHLQNHLCNLKMTIEMHFLISFKIYFKAIINQRLAQIKFKIINLFMGKIFFNLVIVNLMLIIKALLHFMSKLQVVTLHLQVIWISHFKYLYLH